MTEKRTPSGAPEHGLLEFYFEQQKDERVILYYLKQRDVFNIQRLQSRLTDSVLEHPAVQAEARSTIREFVFNFIHLDENTPAARGLQGGISFLEQAFHIPASEIRADQELHRLIRASVLRHLQMLERFSRNAGAIKEVTVWDIIKAARLYLALPDDWLHTADLQRAAVVRLERRLLDVLAYIPAPALQPNDESVDDLKLLERTFGVSLKSVCDVPEVRQRIKHALVKVFQRCDQSDRLVDLMKHNEVLAKVVYELVTTDTEIQQALIAFIIFSAEDSMQAGESANRWNEASIKKVVEYFQLGEYVQKALREWAEEMVMNEHIEPLRFIVKLRFLPAGFFSRAEFSTPFSNALLRHFMVGWIEGVEAMAQEFGLAPETLAVIDGRASQDPDTLREYLIQFVPKLGDQFFRERLPLTYVRILELLRGSLDKDEELADYFVENLDQYYTQPWVAACVPLALEHFSVVKKFMTAIKNDSMWENEPWVQAAADEAYAKFKHKLQAVEQDADGYDDYAQEMQGLSAADPFENHRLRFEARQARVAAALADLMNGKDVVAQAAAMGLDVVEIQPRLSLVNERVQERYQKFLVDVQFNASHAFNADDREALLAPERFPIKITPLLQNVRAFVSRYLIQTNATSDDALSETIDKQLEHGLNDLLTEGFKRFVQIHEIDIPLYDRLYEEFDALRETGRHPLEVYLGRDGIYAWIGRRSQDLARLRKLGFKERKRLKESGEVFAIHPRYMVFPRYFRDYLNHETKKAYLEQEGISPAADPLFYDTGYTGTIPEQIMRIMDFEPDEIEQRIRLLSAPSAHRRVRGVSKNARSEVVEYIEHNAKTEHTAVGLIRDEKTARIRPIAEPTDPQEQFYYLMVRQALSRHYWIRERLHHAPSGDVHLDSEHFLIRLREEYAGRLPADFMNDPRRYLSEHGEVLKSSHGEGPYPDEEISLFALSDGTQVVAKRIELRKAKDARKEFGVLIAAQKAGLPTAEPVGFLSGKQADDGSYLLMEKLDGRSGRTFEKELHASGKYSSAQIASIMREVADKNKAMAELFREKLKIDKRWRIKDTLIEFDEHAGTIGRVIPIDWERVRNFDPLNPGKIDFFEPVNDDGDE